MTQKQIKRKKIIRLVLIAVLIIAFAALSRRLNQSAEAPQTAAPTAAPFTLQTAAPAQETAQQDGLSETEVVESGSYSDVEDVAYYLHTYGHLPDNYITKAEAEDAGWEASEGNLWDVAYGMSIGGDRFGNYEGQLPKGEKYYEADVNYDGGYRSGERIVYTDDGDVWYTSDHYESFEKLY